MGKAHKNILITGFPGVGKTTFITKLAGMLQSLRPAGFYTTEIREGRVRKGFELVSLDGRRGVLSHVNIKGWQRVGKYGVDVAGFETFLDTIDLLGGDTGLVIIDEIGKMECFSKKFRQLMMQILHSDKVLIATIARMAGGFIAEIKRRDDVTLVEITTGNRDTLQHDILALLKGQTER
jgi:nucleoside-triphosphatase